MILRSILIVPLLLLVALVCTAQQVEVKKVPIKNVSPLAGEQMYLSYCTACHGTDGTGTGPAAPAMKIQPADLTMLAKSHGGKFPKLQVFNTILGDTAAPQAHGSKDMPVWGSLFSSFCSGRPTARDETQMRASKLTDYVESLQQK